MALGGYPMVPVRLLSVAILLFLSACGGGGGTDGAVAPSEAEALSISTSNLPSGQTGRAYSHPLVALGGVSPYRWELISGGLPDGLLLEADTGRIAGTPLSPGTFTVAIQVQDAEGAVALAQWTLAIAAADTPAASACQPLDLVVGEVITVSDSPQLAAAIAAINDSGGNRTVLLEDGDYELSALLHIRADNVVIRGRSGNRDRVVLHGQSMTGGLSHVFLVNASHVTIADLSLGLVYYHAIQVQGENGAGHLRVHNVRIFDTGEQMLKGSYDGATGSDNGVVECSLFEYTQPFGPQYYIGGIDVHRGRNWVVRGNTFKNIRSPEDRAAEHAIHFWSDSETPLIEKNRIVNCDRGIGLGLGTRGCTGGSIRNNTIYGDDLGLNSDVGIGLETARNIRVYNNTIYFAHDYPWAIEYRWAASTGNLIVNNLTNAAIASRDGGSATVRNNVTSAGADWFSNSAAGDLHLSRAINTVVDAGEALIDLQEDMDGDLRPIGSGYDIGADEF